MEIDPNLLKVINHASRKRFELSIGGHTAVSEYIQVQGRIVFPEKSRS